MTQRLKWSYIYSAALSPPPLSLHQPSPTPIPSGTCSFQGQILHCITMQKKKKKNEEIQHMQTRKLCNNNGQGRSRRWRLKIAPSPRASDHHPSSASSSASFHLSHRCGRVWAQTQPRVSEVNFDLWLCCFPEKKNKCGIMWHGAKKKRKSAGRFRQTSWVKGCRLTGNGI